MRKQKLKCQVCFFSRFDSLSSTQLITCQGCKRISHRYCYLPNLQGKYFMCDVCQNKQKNQKCCICHNDGLLKKTQEGQYAHPVCLMVSKQSIVKSYKDLSFNYLVSRRKSKTLKCEVCNKNGFVSDMFVCYQKQCGSNAHFYCILQQHCRDNQQTGKWVQQLRVFQKANIDYLLLVQQIFKKYIKLFSISAHRAIYGNNNKKNQQQPVYIVYCRKHCENIRRCYCISIQDQNSQLDWIFCDSCNEWYHFQCQGLTNAIQQEQYTCKCCKAWHKKFNSKQEPILKYYPRMYFYDMVQIQLYSENKNYRLSNSMYELLRRVPFACSIKYINQNIKKKLISTLIKNINFMTVKQTILQSSSQALIDKAIKKNKNLQDVLWKIDFIISSDPITSLNKFKRIQYSFEEVLEMFKCFQKRYKQGCNIMKPAVKQLLKLKNNVKKQQQDEQQQVKQEQQDQYNKVINQIKNWIKQAKKQKSKSKINQSTILSFYSIFKKNETLRCILKDLLDKNYKIQISIFKPTLLYDDQNLMLMHFQLNYMYKKYKKCRQDGVPHKQLAILNAQANRYYRKCQREVKIQNYKILRQLAANNHQKQNFNFNIYVPAKNKQPIKMLKNCRYTNDNYSQLESLWVLALKKQYLLQILQKLELKSSSVNFCYVQINKICLNFEQQKQYPQFRMFVEFYKICRKFVQDLNATNMLFQNYSQDVNLMEHIKICKIDKPNIYRFCQFFISTCKIGFDNLNPYYLVVIREKVDEFFNMIEQRSMVFQCEIQFKAACAILNKYKLQRPKIEQIIKNNDQLIKMLVGVTFECLEKYVFVDVNLQKLKRAKQFCHENNLQFRISKIEYMKKLFQLKKQAFQYFPYDIIIDYVNSQTMIKKQTQQITEVDYYVLKKFIHKMKLLKYPTTDYFYKKMYSLYQDKQSYVSFLTMFISNYVSNLNNQPVFQGQKLKKQQVIMLIKSKQKDLVTCHGQQDQILIICDLYDQMLDKMDNLMRFSNNNLQNLMKLYREFIKFPFDNDSNIIFIRFCGYLYTLCEKHNFNNNQNNLQLIQIQQYAKKLQLDETSIKGQYSTKSQKTQNKILQRIQKSPKTVNFIEIQQIYNKIKKEGNDQQTLNVLQNYINKYKIIIKDSYEVINKYVKGNSFNLIDIQNTRKLLFAYKNQYILDEDIEKLSYELRIYDSISQMTNSEDQNWYKKLSQSFYQLMYNRSASMIASQRIQNSKQLKSSRSGSTKTKIVLK